MAERPIIYEPHPVTPERKAELLARGFRIIDAIYDPGRWTKKPAPVDSGWVDVPPAPPEPVKRGPGRPRKEPVTDGA